MRVALLPVLVLVIALAATGVPTAAILAAVSAFCLVGVIVGGIRRYQRPRERRFVLPIHSWLDEVRAATVGAGSRLDAVLTVALLVSVVLATGTLGYAILAPNDAEAYSSFSLLAADESGSFVADDYPDELVLGEEEQLAVGIANDHPGAVTYTVVVELQAVETAGQSATVLEETELERLQVEVGSGEERQVPHTVTPTMTGEDLRLQYYLYEGDAPADATAQTADRRLFLWVTVAEPA
jgi:uncharacterized membrane protein